MSISEIKYIRNIFLILLFVLLSSILVVHHSKLTVEGTWDSAAAYTQKELTPSPTLTITPSPTGTPTFIPTITPSPTPVLAAQSNNLVSVDIQESNSLVDKVNEYRKSKGLAEVKSDSYTCALAQKRAEEISSNFSHDGFQQLIDNKSFEYPTYSNVVENIAQGGSPVDMWLNSPLHRENMEKDTPYVCIEQSGEFYAYEGWKP